MDQGVAVRQEIKQCVLEAKGGQNEQMGPKLLSGPKWQRLRCSQRFSHAGSHWGPWKEQFQWNNEDKCRIEVRSRQKEEEKLKTTFFQGGVLCRKGDKWKGQQTWVPLSPSDSSTDQNKLSRSLNFYRVRVVLIPELTTLTYTPQQRNESKTFIYHSICGHQPQTLCKHGHHEVVECLKRTSHSS